MQQETLDLQKSVCDQHKKAHFSDCLHIRMFTHILSLSHKHTHAYAHTLAVRTEVEIELCVGEAIKKGRFPTDLLTHTHTHTHTHTQPSVIELDLFCRCAD